MEQSEYKSLAGYLANDGRLVYDDPETRSKVFCSFSTDEHVRLLIGSRKSTMLSAQITSSITN